MSKPTARQVAAWKRELEQLSNPNRDDRRAELVHLLRQAQVPRVEIQELAHVTTLGGVDYLRRSHTRRLRGERRKRYGREAERAGAGVS